MSSMNGGFPNGERASLLSGLRTSGPRMNAAQQQQQMQQEQYRQLFLQQQQQQQFYAAAQNNPAQAQLFAFQQSQIELQLQQIQMANLALQDQILRQQQQAMQQQVQAQQNTQVQRQPSPPYNARNAQRATSGSPVIEQNKTPVWTGNEHDAAARQERWGALRNLQQARKQREGSPSTVSPQAAAPSAGNNNDWQAERMRYAAGGTKAGDHSSSASPPLVDKPTTSIVANLEDMAKQITHESGHAKTASTDSSVSIESLSMSEAGTQFSPNRGPALVLSSPGDEFEDEEDGFPLHGGKEEPMSPSLNASMRAVNIHGRLAGVSGKEDNINNKQGEKGEAKKPKRERHTLILSSSLPAFAAGSAKATDDASSTGSVEDSASSSGSSSPTTSDRSEVASFESTGTNATSAPATSPTSATHADKDKETEKEEKVPDKTMNAKAAVFNPNAAAFAPASASVVAEKTASGTSTAAAATGGPRYPAALSLRSQTTTPIATPPPSMRVFTAPASVGSAYSAGTPNNGNTNNVVTVLRQPKGPVDESELGNKNFAGMIRRKAVGALRVATYSGGRISPQSSPVVGGFPGDVQSFGGSPQLGQGGMPSPTMNGSGAFAAFGADLAQRAMKRRSQQMQMAGGINPGLGMY